MTEINRSVSVASRPDGYAVAIENLRGNAIVADEPAALGGNDLGFSPFELVASGLGACTSMTLLMYARSKQIPLNDVAVDLRFWRSGENGFQRDTILRRIEVAGPLDECQADRLRHIARRCPVHLVLERGVDIVDELVVRTDSDAEQT
jgi:putative redox protein